MALSALDGGGGEAPLPPRIALTIGSSIKVAEEAEVEVGTSMPHNSISKHRRKNKTQTQRITINKRQ